MKSGKSRKHPLLRRVLLITAICLAAILMVPFLMIGAVALFLGEPPQTPGPEPLHLRLSWVGDPHTTMVVAWDTMPGISGYDPQVEYGTAAGNLDREAAGDTRDYPGSSIDIHVVELEDLEPGTRYYYRCGNLEHGWSNEHSFVTPSLKGPFTFAAMGDSRDPYNIAGCPFYESWDNREFKVWNRACASLAGDNFDFAINTGDFVYHYRKERPWNKWFDAVELFSPRVAFMSAHGNHEHYCEAYLNRFIFPGDGLTYSFRVGNTAFICLDTGFNDDQQYELVRSQSDWLAGELARAADDCDWTVVFLHRPPYASAVHYNQEDLIEVWVPLFDEYGVDLVIGGHVHYYERSYPMKGGSVTDTSTDFYAFPDGTIYLTSGGTGAPLATPKPVQWAAVQEETYNYCLVDVLPDRTLRVTSKGFETGEIIDSFTITKGQP